MKKISLLLVLLLIFLSGCQGQQKQPETTEVNQSSPAVTRITATNMPTATPSDDMLTETNFSSSFEAYGKKYTELVDKYGNENLVNVGTEEDPEACYLIGVCVVDLLDFNGDGTQDLLVVHSNDNFTGKNMDRVNIPQAKTYEIEVWTYTGNTLKQLLYQPCVGDYYSFLPDSWDSDNCFVTVYKNDLGLPVIQLYSEGAGSISYTNLYYTDGKLATDTLVYQGKAFTKNGISCTEDVWNRDVSGYNKILLSAYLSSADFSVDYLKKYKGVAIENTLKQTEQVEEGLFQEQPTAMAFQVVDAPYVSLYLKELDSANRTRIDMEQDGDPFMYSVYDLDENGVPELITKFGNCEGEYLYTVYTAESGQLKKCGEFYGAETQIYINNEQGMVAYQAHMGYYTIKKITLEKTTLKMKVIAEDYTTKDYPTLKTFGLGEYQDYLGEFDSTNPVLVYACGIKK